MALPACVCSLVPAPLVAKTVLSASHCPSCTGSRRGLGLVSGLSSTPLLHAGPSDAHCRLSRSFAASSGTGKRESSSVVLHSQDSLASSGSLTSPTDFRMFVRFCKEASRDFDRDFC